MAIEIINEAWYAPVPSHTCKLVLLAMADNADRTTRECWPSKSDVAERTDVSEQTVRRCWRQLEELGVIEAVGRTRYGRRWRITPAGDWPPRTQGVQAVAPDDGGHLEFDVDDDAEHAPEDAEADGAATTPARGLSQADRRPSARTDDDRDPARQGVQPVAPDAVEGGQGVAPGAAEGVQRVAPGGPACSPSGVQRVAPGGTAVTTPFSLDEPSLNRQPPQPPHAATGVLAESAAGSGRGGSATPPTQTPTPPPSAEQVEAGLEAIVGRAPAGFAESIRRGRRSGKARGRLAQLLADGWHASEIADRVDGSWGGVEQPDAAVLARLCAIAEPAPSRVAARRRADDAAAQAAREQAQAAAQQRSEALDARIDALDVADRQRLAEQAAARLPRLRGRTTPADLERVAVRAMARAILAEADQADSAADSVGADA